MGRVPCCDKNGLKKGPWIPEEDQKLVDYIQKHGCGNWRTLPKNAGLARCGKSCRLRWTNYLRPDIKRGRFSFEEEETIIQQHSILGNKWSAIAARLPGRTDNEIKNYWNTHIRKRLLRTGIDPVTHNPRLDLLELSSLLSNPAFYNAAHYNNVSRLLGIGPLVNSELLQLVSNLVSSHQSSLFTDQSSISQLQPNADDQANLWQGQDNGIHCNFSENSVGYNNLQQSLPQFVSDNQNYAMSTTTSVVSTTPDSSPATTQLNSSSTYVNGSTEDERDSYRSEFFEFEIPSELLDVSEFM